MASLMTQMLLLFPVLLGIAMVTMRNPKDHGMFKLAPSDHKITLKSGVQTTIPFHAYDSKAMIVVGTTNINKTREAMKGQDYEPVETEDGKAIVIFWIMNYPNSTAGPYKELVYAIVSTQLGNPRKTTWNQNPYTLANIYLDPNTILYVNKLWLSEQLPIDYGIEVLGTDKYFMKTPVDKWSDIVEIDWKAKDDSAILQAKLEAIPNKLKQAWGNIALAKQLGFITSLKLLLAPSTFTLASPKGINKEISRLTGGKGPRYHITGFGDIGAVAYDPSFDTFILGDSLKFLEFDPQLKLYSPNYDFIFYPPIVSPTALRT